MSRFACVLVFFASASVAVLAIEEANCLGKSDVPDETSLLQGAKQQKGDDWSLLEAVGHFDINSMKEELARDSRTVETVTRGLHVASGTSITDGGEGKEDGSKLSVAVMTKWVERIKGKIKYGCRGTCTFYVNNLDKNPDTANLLQGMEKQKGDDWSLLEGVGSFDIDSMKEELAHELRTVEVTRGLHVTPGTWITDGGEGQAQSSKLSVAVATKWVERIKDNIKSGCRGECPFYVHSLDNKPESLLQGMNIRKGDDWSLLEGVGHFYIDDLMEDLAADSRTVETVTRGIHVTPGTLITDGGKEQEHGSKLSVAVLTTWIEKIKEKIKHGCRGECAFYSRSLDNVEVY